MANRFAGARQQGEQAPLLVDDEADALRALAFQAGGLKELACRMKPDLADEPEKAHRWILDCLNPDRHHAIHIEHLVRALQVGADIGCEVLLGWLMQRAGYQVPAKAIPKSRRQVMLEQQAEHIAKAAALQRELDEMTFEQKGAA